MSDEDIRIKLTADSSGATAAFNRLKKEVATSDQGLKQLSTQGKQTGQALKDAAGVLGPEFQILGDRIDHITGALGDVKGASLATKGALAGLVAVGAFEVGKMLGDIIFQTQQWEQSLEEARKKTEVLQRQVADRAAMRAATMSQEELQREMRGVSESMARQTKQVEESEKAWSNFATADYWVAGENNRRKEVEGIQANIEAQRQLMQVYQDEQKRRAQDQIVQQQRDAAAAIEARAKAEAEALAQQNRLAQTQEDYLANLDAELVRLKEGEEAYLRLTLAKQGFTDQTIDAAVAMKAEADAIREQARKASEARTPSGGGGPPDRQTMPGMVQATQQRFITRGTGNNEMQKLLDAQKAANKLAQDALQVAKQMDQRLARIDVE